LPQDARFGLFPNGNNGASRCCPRSISPAARKSHRAEDSQAKDERVRVQAFTQTRQDSIDRREEAMAATTHYASAECADADGKS
jgi:hypothetical protein